MKLKTITTSLALLFLTVVSCKDEKNNFDASGQFEAEETIISSEATGIIKVLNLEEGQQLTAGQHVGYVDSTQLALRKKQLQSQIRAILIKTPDVNVQLAALQQQLETAQKDKIRISNLVKADAAPTKQLDDINGNIEVLKKQIAAQESTLRLSSAGLTEETAPLQVQIEQLNDQIRKCDLINPVNGTVLTKYANVNEMTSAGKPLYKIADLRTIILRAYITGDQLPLLKIDQKVSVKTDDGKGGYISKEGTVTWISDKAEFTPKTIQTKDERANLVYAIKVRVANDGSYKIGMYGELKFI